MGLRRAVSGVVIGATLMLAALPARAGIPVIDVANLVNSIQQVLAWAQQAQDMVQQYEELRRQVEQVKTMTNKLDGMRNLGTILNDPSIRAALPPEMRDASQMLLNASALSTSRANVDQILGSFGVRVPPNSSAGQAAADTLGRVQQILSSTQGRVGQLDQLANRVNGTADAKDSLDMINRGLLEASSISNQVVQTMAALESARQGAELRRLADNQGYFTRLNSASGRALKTYTY